LPDIKSKRKGGKTMNLQRQVQGIKAEFDAMLRRLPKNLDPNLITTTIKQQIDGERISIEFWDPENSLNRCILENAHLTKTRDLEIIARGCFEKGMVEVKIHRHRAIPCSEDCKGWQFPERKRPCGLARVHHYPKGEVCFEFQPKREGKP